MENDALYDLLKKPLNLSPFAAMGPTAANPDRFTNTAGDTTITDFGKNTVTTLTGDAARRYDANPKYGYAPPASLFEGSLSGKLAPAAPAVPAMVRQWAESRAPAAPPAAVFGGSLSGKLAGFDSAPGALAGPAVGERRMSTNDWTTINAGRDPRRIAALGLRYGGSGDAFTPGVMAFNRQQDRADAAYGRSVELGELVAARQAERDRSKALLDTQLGIYKAGETKKAELRAPWEVGGQDPRAYQAEVNSTDLATRMTGAAKSEADAAKARTEAAAAEEDRAFLTRTGLTRAEWERRGGKVHDIQAPEIAAGVAPSRVAGKVVERQAAAREKEAADLAKAQAEAKKTQSEAEAIDVDGEGLPVTHVKDGITFYKSGGKWRPAAASGGFPMVAPAVGAQPEAAKADAYVSGKVYSSGKWKGRYLGDGKWEAVK